jgi:hypothetical protein
MISDIRAWVMANALAFVGAIAVIAIALLAVQTVRIDGLQVKLPLIGLVGPKGLIAENARLVAANKEFLAQRNAARAESERITKANIAATEKADENVTENLTQERAGADAFIARGGVRKCPAPRADTPAPSQGAAVDAGSGALPVMDDLPEVVTVLPEDVHICTENTVKARAWQKWGLTIEANHGGDKVR